MPATDANVYGPDGVAVDASGNFYIAAYNQNRVFKVTSGGTITVVAGIGGAGYGGDGVTGGATSALLNGPAGVAVDTTGNVYISDYNNFVIRKVDTTGTITTIAGIAGGCSYNGDGAPATSYYLCHPWGLALDGSGNLFIADGGTCRVRKLVLASDTISTYAGDGTCGYNNDSIAATSAELYEPWGVAVDGTGNVYIADTYNNRIRLVKKSTGVITTIAGSGTHGYSGDTGPATTAEISYVYQLAVNSAGTSVILADANNQRIRQFTVGGNIKTVAGTGTACSPALGDGGPATSACFYNPQGIAANTAGTTVYVGDYSNQRVRKFTIAGNINTVAGNGSGTVATLVSGIPATGVVFNNPWGVLEDSSGNVYIADQSNCMVRKLVKSTNLVNFFAGTGPSACGYAGDGGLATSAKLYYPTALAKDSTGNIYIADTYNHIIRKVNSSGDISTFAGIPQEAGYTGDGGAATSAKLEYPEGLWIDPKNNVYIADTYNHVIRKVSGGTISTVAGTGAAGYLGDGDQALTARLYYPHSVAVDSAGNVFIADTSNNRVREVIAATGIITTVAGNGTAGNTGDGVATQHSINNPFSVYVDANDNLWFSDTYNAVVRWVSPTGIMTTFGGNGTAGLKGDLFSATSGEMYYPYSITQDSTGDFLVSDFNNGRVRGISAFSALNTSMSSVNFGLVPVGSTSSSQTLTLSAIGPVTIDSTAISPGFVEYDDCGSGVSNESNCSIYLTFAPTASGTQNGSLTIEDNGYFSDVTTVSLSGAGTAIALTGDPVSFGNQAVKSTSAASSITVTNKGTTAVTMGAITLNETTDFAIATNSCPASGSTLAAKGTCAIGVTFTPATTGAKKGAVIINDNDPSSPQVIGLSGTGTSTVGASPASVTFASVPISATSASSEVILTNSTGKSLTLGTPAVTLTGPFVNAKTTSCTNGLVIASGQTCDVFVQFKPTAEGYATGTLSIADSDPTSPQVVALSGLGTGVLFTPASLNLGTANVGSQVNSTVTITNEGPTPLTFSNGAITGTNYRDFSTNNSDPPCSGSLAPHAVCTFTIYFIPSKVGKETATYQVFDNSAGSPQSLSLTGTGQ